MRKLVFWMAAAAVIASQVPDANATTFNWSYSDGGSNVGAGTLQATFGGADTYVVTSISGIANGLTILGLSDYLGPDQLVFSPSPPDVALDTLGVSFSVGDLGSFNLYEDDGNFDTDSPFACGSVYCLIGPGTNPPSGTETDSGPTPVVAVDFSLTPVSEPATIPLLAVGFGALGLLARRQKRKGLAAIAAV